MDDTGHPELSSLDLMTGKTFGTFDERANEGLQSDELKSLQKALKAAHNFAEKPKGWLVMLGTYGSGKTHLAAAIANYRSSLGRAWAKFEKLYPDGICLDAEGAIWVAAPFPGELVRVRKGGNITHRLKVSSSPYACVLGGPDRRTLFVCTAQSHDPDEARLKPGGKIETVEVEIPGAGFP